MKFPIWTVAVVAAGLASLTAAPKYAVTDLGSLGGTQSNATAINSKGQVVGRSKTTGDASVRAFRFLSGNLTDLGTLGGTSSEATGLNSAGKIVGFSTNSGNATRAMLFSSGIRFDLGTLGGSNSSARGINSSGLVVGESQTANNTATRAFTADTSVLPAQMVDLGSLGGTNSYATAVNNSGRIAGYSQIAGDTAVRAFRYTPEIPGTPAIMRDLRTLGGTNSYAAAINASSKVVGRSQVAGDGATRAFLFVGGNLTDLGTLGGTNSSAKAINVNDAIVGSSDISGDIATHAFLYADGVMVDLNTLIPATSGWTLTDATGINDDGQIVGTGENPQGLIRPYLLTPLPPAPTLAVAGKTTLVTRSAKLTIRGTTTGTVTKVTYRVGTKGAFRTATGLGSWQFIATLVKGKNPITILATGPGGTSKSVTVNVTRK